MSRFDGRLTAAHEAKVELADLLAAFDPGAASTGQDRRKAIACYLSGAEGWRDAVQRLDGAFARERPDDPDSGSNRE